MVQSNAGSGLGVVEIMVSVASVRRPHIVLVLDEVLPGRWVYQIVVENYYTKKTKSEKS